MDGRQVEEFVLTATQTLLGVAMLIGLRFSGRWPTAFFVLFAASFVFTSTEARWIVSGIYAILAVVLPARNGKLIPQTSAAPFRRIKKE
jgi:cation:H+ antiporter